MAEACFLEHSMGSAICGIWFGGYPMQFQLPKGPFNKKSHGLRHDALPPKWLCQPIPHFCRKSVNVFTKHQTNAADRFRFSCYCKNRLWDGLINSFNENLRIMKMVWMWESISQMLPYFVIIGILGN